MKRYITTFICASALLFSACEKQLDIVPKGKVTLGTVDELELLLNQEFQVSALPYQDVCILSGESLGAFDQVSTILSQPNTLSFAYMTYDEAVDRATLTKSDNRYNDIYKTVNYMNTVITKIDESNGDTSRKPQIKAEAKAIRAYMHWLAAMYYARQYDPATAADEGGIAYVTGTEVGETKTKLSLQQTYDMILSDISDEVISLLPEKTATPCVRGDKGWGNAVRALVLCQMKRYAEALPYAQEAVRLHPQMFDRSSVKESGLWTQDQLSPNNYIWIGNGSRITPTLLILSLEAVKLFEANDYVLKYSTRGWDADWGENYSGIPGTRMFADFTTSCNAYGPTSELMHYVAAECLIRTGSISEGLSLVDDVRVLRIENAQPLSAANEAEAMALLQKAKYIECLGTPFNFFDIKRWNSEAAYRRTVTHKLGSLGTYSLGPDSPLWVFPFPLNARRYNPTLTNNY